MKTCNVIGCNNPVWGKGVCSKHTPKTPLKKTSFTVNKAKVYVNIFPNTVERNDFFMSIWNKRQHVCEICGKWLGKEPRTYMFDHLLEKYKYPNLEYKEENILLVCLEDHDLKTRGIINEKYQEKINQVRKIFNII
jgi:hypothetical protein